MPLFTGMTCKQLLDSIQGVVQNLHCMAMGVDELLQSGFRVRQRFIRLLCRLCIFFEVRVSNGDGSLLPACYCLLH